MELPAMSVKSKARIMNFSLPNLEPPGEPIHAERNPKPAVIVHIATVSRFVSRNPAGFPRAHFE